MIICDASVSKRSMMSSSSSSSFVVASRNKKPREEREEKEKDKKNGVDLETLNYCETPNETENESLNIPLSLCLVFFFVSSLSFDFCHIFFGRPIKKARLLS
jgi:hypothetical protein